MAERQTRLNAEIRENLVAYLDGELDEAASRDVDQLLARNAVARHEVEVLARTWELLDLLPRPQATAEFASRTVATIKLKSTRPEVDWSSWARAFRVVGLAIVWATGLGAVCWAGYSLPTRWLDNPHRRLLNDLPVVEELDKWKKIESAEFLKELRARNVFRPGENPALGQH